MGRKSALTPDQWIEVERRIVVDGESVWAVAKEFGVNESSIRRKIKPSSADKADTAQKHHPELRTLALEKVRVEEESRVISDKIAELPYAKQVIVHDLSRRLANITSSLTSAAELGAATGHRLHGIANQQAQMIDDANPDVEILKVVAALAKVGNEAMAPGLTLLTATKKAAEAFDDAEAEVPRRVTVSVVDASA